MTLKRVRECDICHETRDENPNSPAKDWWNITVVRNGESVTSDCCSPACAKKLFARLEKQGE